MKPSRILSVVIVSVVLVLAHASAAPSARAAGAASRAVSSGLYIGTHPSSRSHGLGLQSLPAASTSTNWCGYVVQTSFPSGSEGSIRDARGTWTVPFVLGGTTDAFSADWVGIDGYADKQVEQIGTEQDWVDGSPEYFAWWEMVPDRRTEVFISSLTISPGDVMSARVQWISGNKFRLSMTDVTTGQSFATVQTMRVTTERRSAEWIVEAPTIGTTVAPFADLGASSFTSCSVNVNGKTGAISGTGRQFDPITLASNNGIIELASPSALTAGGSAFVVTAPGTELVPPTTTSDATSTYDDAAVIHLFASDNVGGSGLAATHYRIDGAPTQTGNLVTVPTYGPHSVSFWSVDRAGNVETPHVVAFAVNDTMAPTTSSDVVSSYIGGALIHLLATDNTGGSGVAVTHYTLDGVLQQPYAGAAFSVTTTGTHELTFWSVDKAGNVEATHTATFSITPQLSTSLTLSTTATSLLRYKYVGLSSTLVGGVPAGTVVRFEARKPGSTRYVLVASRTVDASGHSSLRYKLTLRGYYSFRVRFVGNLSFTASTSPLRRVRSR